MNPADHWQEMYATRSPDEVGWYEPDPITSRRLIGHAVARGAWSVIDIGGGASSLVDHLLDLGVGRVAVLDISDAGLDIARRRLGERADHVEWIVGDVTQASSLGRFDVWHDRAAFHFLLEEDDRRRYAELAGRTVDRGGCAIMATFSPDSPERCSGLPVPAVRRRAARDRVRIGLLPGGERAPGAHHTAWERAAFRLLHLTPGGPELTDGGPHPMSTRRSAGHTPGRGPWMPC